MYYYKSMTYIPDPANYTMKGNGSKPVILPESPDIPRLDTLSREELIALVERMARQCGMVAAMSDAETAQAMLDELAHTALKPIVAGVNMKADIQSRMNAIDKWLDRKQGKPQQSVTVTEKKQIQLIIECGISPQATYETIDSIPVTSD